MRGAGLIGAGLAGFAASSRLVSLALATGFVWFCCLSGSMDVAIASLVNAIEIDGAFGDAFASTVTFSRVRALGERLAFLAPAAAIGA